MQRKLLLICSPFNKYLSIYKISSASFVMIYVLHLSPENVYGSPLSGSSSYAYDEAGVKSKIRELEVSLLSGDPQVEEFSGFSPAVGKSWNWDELLALTPQLDLKEVLVEAARAVADGDFATAYGFLDVLEQMVSVSGSPIQRLGAYMAEGLRARLEGSGSNIYRALKCNEPTGRESALTGNSLT